jgi:hypothetical protein
MSIHLINPSHVSFGVGVITPRWLYVLAQATPGRFGDPIITDETLEPLDPAIIARGDIVGIGIYTGNALRGRMPPAPSWSSAAFTRRCFPKKRAISAARTRSSRATATSSGRESSTTARLAVLVPRPRINLLLY